MKKPLKVTITGAAGNIGYALAFRVAAGDVFGADQPVILQLMELPMTMGPLGGVGMEMEDCAFPLVHDVVLTDDPKVGFRDTDYALLVGAKPRTKGMERSDLISENARIFSTQGRAINEYASREVRVMVVGNPANTNAMIAAANAPDLPRERFTAMARLDHNRAIGMLAKKTSALPGDVKRMIVWGNHSPTMHTDLTHCTVKGQPAMSLVPEDWYRDVMVPTVQRRGAAVIEARGASSAASAAASVVDHVRDWFLGTPEGDWVSMGVHSDGSYGIQEGLVYSFPVTCQAGNYQIVPGLEVTDFGKERMKVTEQELLGEREIVADLL